MEDTAGCVVGVRDGFLGPSILYLYYLYSIYRREYYDTIIAGQIESPTDLGVDRTQVSFREEAVVARARVLLESHHGSQVPIDPAAPTRHRGEVS